MEQAYVITAGGEIYEKQIPEDGEQGSLEAKQELVGGYIERLPTKLGDIFLNEEGYPRGYPVNTCLMVLLDWPSYLLGDAIILKQGLDSSLKERINLMMKPNEAPSKHEFFESGEEQ